MNDREIIEVVQENCHIADSRFASEYTLCIYLLKMREYYRWEKQLKYGDNLPSDDIGDWLSEREQQWDNLDNSDYHDICIDGVEYSPFDSTNINKALKPYGLVYSGGLGLQGRPHFFLAELNRHEALHDYHIFVSNKELARDMTAPPAMSLQNNIYIRRESLRRMLWERLEEWRWRKSEGAMSRALGYYDFDHHLEQSLDQMTDHETDVLLQHEIGEIKAGQELGEDWHDMLDNMPRSAGEIMARAIRDHLADCTTTLPMLLREQRHASLHFYFGNFNAMRKQIFPSLYKAYQHWHETDDLEPLSSLIHKGEQHWRQLAFDILDCYQARRQESLPGIVDLVDKNRL
jgi:hypothetical protein